MTLQEAIQHCRKQVQEQAKKGCYSCAEEHQQLAEWLKELKAYRDARAEINQALYDDARGEQNDYERGRKSGIFLCESIISVKLGESRSEIPNTCGDAISRQEAIRAIEALQRPIMREESNYYQFKFSGMSEAREAVENLPSVSPQQKVGKWELVRYDGLIGNWHCSECRTIIPHMPEETDNTPIYKWCPNCGAKMEVK